MGGEISRQLFRSAEGAGRRRGPARRDGPDSRHAEPRVPDAWRRSPATARCIISKKARRAAAAGREAAAAAAAAAASPPESRELSWEDVQPVDLLGLEVGYRLVPLVNKNQNGDLLARIRGVRRKLSQDLGLPRARRAHPRQPRSRARMAIASTSAACRSAKAQVYPEREMAINPGPRVRPAQGHRDARSGVRHGSGVDRAVRARARADARLHRGGREHGRSPRT